MQLEKDIQLKKGDTIEILFNDDKTDYVKIKDNQYIITKEWYTDPFADSLNLENIKSELDKNNIYISTMKVKKLEKELEIRFSVKVQKDHSMQGLFELLSSYDEIIEISTNF